MSRIRHLVPLIAVGLALSGAGCATAPTERPLVNLSDAKAAVVRYHDSGTYAAELREVAERATAWLEQRAARRHSDERLAVVFDIDETVLSNYDQMLSQDFGYVPAVWQAWVNEAAAPALVPVRAVYRTARRLGLTVFFVTGRQEATDRLPTAANLAREGMGEYERLILLTPEMPGATAAERKAAIRAALEAEGFRIIASIGDQHSDLVGGHAERTFKLPNPFYRIP